MVQNNYDWPQPGILQSIAEAAFGPLGSSAHDTTVQQPLRELPLVMVPANAGV